MQELRGEGFDQAVVDHLGLHRIVGDLLALSLVAAGVELPGALEVAAILVGLARGRSGSSLPNEAVSPPAATRRSISATVASSKR